MNKKNRDQRIAEITRWITNNYTDEHKIKVLEEHIKECNPIIESITNRINDIEDSLSSERTNLEYYQKDMNKMQEGIKLLKERIKENN